MLIEFLFDISVSALQLGSESAMLETAFPLWRRVNASFLKVSWMKRLPYWENDRLRLKADNEVDLSPH